MNAIFFFPVRRLYAMVFLAALAGCENASRPPQQACPDQTVVAAAPKGAAIKHRPKKMPGSPAALPGTVLASKDSVAAFFGGKRIKLALAMDKKLYLVTYGGSDPQVTLLSAGDESPSGGEGDINSPLFSPDGAKLAYAGTLYGSPIASFVRGLPVSPEAAAWRVPVDTTGLVAGEPHWVEAEGKTWIYFVTHPGSVEWNEKCDQLLEQQRLRGSTYRTEVIGDSAMGQAEATGWPGAFKGGLSKDLRWAGTTYTPSALYDTEGKRTLLLAQPYQQCNPSMNPYPAGSRHTDYMMILGFGGATVYNLIDGTAAKEGQHENLWIYNKDDKVVWMAGVPDKAKYRQWQKPEWSTHPDFATATALYKINTGSIKGDLYVVRTGDLADAEEGALNGPRGFLRIAEGGFTESSFSHLWVEK